ncbi:hypothetical protein C2G38_2264839 [Gigaspora rosea]|uniref:Uncharacterized protein n=1 Tax=Gigaspora rosea TaxID=44941 RepID=A0A397UJB5_9GLOM|nr:hypothetical protein C2G38_2264839 [Gigaspora rosea]
MSHGCTNIYGLGTPKNKYEANPLHLYFPYRKTPTVKADECLRTLPVSPKNVNGISQSIVLRFWFYALHDFLPYIDTLTKEDQENRENNLLPNVSKKYLEARRLIRLPNSGSYAPEIGIAICFSCDQLVYTGQRKKNIENYNYIGMERHWKFSCTGNKYCGVTYNEYLLKVKKKSISGYNYDNEYVLHRYELWMQNAIKKTKRAREIGKKIQACIIIQRKFIEYYYRPDGLCASELAQYYKLL